MGMGMRMANEKREKRHKGTRKRKATERQLKVQPLQKPYIGQLLRKATG
jgi:hypothetical protein